MAAKKLRGGKTEKRRRSGGRKSNDVLEMLRGGDRRSVGHADRVAKIVAKDSSLFPRLIAAMWDEDNVVRMRAADAASIWRAKSAGAWITRARVSAMRSQVQDSCA